MPNTEANWGIRQNFPGSGDCNFEPGTQYMSRCAFGGKGLWFMGITYNVGDLLPFDVSGTSYSRSATALLLSYWEQGWIAPIVSRSSERHTFQSDAYQVGVFS